MSAPRSTAAKRATSSAKVSTAADFKKGKKGRILPLPSGLVVRARRVALQTFIQQGDVPNPLLPIVEEALKKGQEADIDKIIGEEVDLDMVNEMYELVKLVACQVILEPVIHPDDYEPEEDEDPEELIYVSELEDEDLMFLFQWSTGGTDDVAQFRREAEESLVSLGKGEGAGKVS